MAEEKSMYDLWKLVGELGGKMETFCDAQVKINDEIFTRQRSNEGKVNSLLQTRRFQRWLFVFSVGSIGSVMAVVAYFWPHISAGP